ncbi:MAG: hypothetical protein MUQ00_10155 [Candidatus Aminicenantes bacterium]|nr:hypothetical protein [Candidatus Aminicenantes bacterium]
MKRSHILVLISLFLYSCSGQVEYFSAQPSLRPKPDGHLIEVITQIEKIPANSYALGVVDASLWPTAGFKPSEEGKNAILESLKKKARSVGGDAIYIMDYKEADSSTDTYKSKAIVLALLDTSEWNKSTLTEDVEMVS